ncbi:MAG: hypothetical protein SF162_19950 [bacterium]|nr:hypothetical protein [bacterium]
MRKLLWIVVVLALAVPAAFAQEPNALEVVDQVVTDGTVVFPSLTVDRAGFIVIHIDNGGSPGPVIGFTPLAVGTTANVRVSIDAAAATPVLFGMLHEDTGEAGVYEFGTVEGADGPMRDSAGNVLVTPFNVAIINTLPQLVSEDGSVTIPSVTFAEGGWVVIHASADGAPGPVIGQTQVGAGTTTDVVVTLAEEGRTGQLFPMLHVDTGVVGEYEFGTVEGADGPVVINGAVATVGFQTTPFLSVSPQAVLAGDGQTANPPRILVSGVLSNGPGFVVIHADNEGAPGPVLTQVAVPSGYSQNVEIPFPADIAITPVVWPMLHVDDNTVGTYEFGSVEGADGPVRDEAGNVITFPINIAPSITVSTQTVVDGTVTIPSLVIDQAGWLVIHASADGAPGPVIGQTFIPAGYSEAVVVAIDAASAGSQVFPMLHYDTGEAGVYEFGAVEGADAPVVSGGQVVVVPMELQ